MVFLFKIVSHHSAVLRILCFLLLSLSLLVAADKPAPSWLAVEDCRLGASKSNDGDSFHFSLAGLPEKDEFDHILRLYFIDTPETNTGLKTVDEQAEYFSTPVNVVLKYGKEAARFTETFLGEPFRIYTRQKIAPGASRKQRWYGVVQRQRDGKLLHEALVEAGLAKVTSVVCDYPSAEAGAKHKEMLLVLEGAARDAKRGIWSESRDAHGSTPGQKGATPAGLVNLNTATQTELEKLPGVGGKTAAAIMAGRPFKKVEDLLGVPGIGEKKFAGLRDLVFAPGAAKK